MEAKNSARLVPGGVFRNLDNEISMQSNLGNLVD